MNRIQFESLWNLPIGCLFILLLSGFACRKDQRDGHKRPNFIVVYTDDQQFNALGAIGNQVIITPNIDRVASGSMAFHEAHVVFSLCSPSRAALLTGRYGSQNGVLGLGSTLKAGERTLAQFLKQHNYNTAMTGKWHIKPTPDQLGFDICSYFFGNGTYYGRKVIHYGDTIFPQNHVDEFGVQQSIKFIEKSAFQANPFFLFHCPQTPHMNGELIWDAEESTKALYRIDAMPVPANHLDDLQDKPPYLKNVRNKTQADKYGYPDSTSIRLHTRDYYAVITELDKFLGELFNKIDELNLWDNTYLIFMSDNGWMLGDHGFTSKVLPYRPSTLVPLFIKGPEIDAGVTRTLVSNLDIFPTILQLADIPISNNIHGRSLVPLLHGDVLKDRDHLIYEGLGSYGGSGYNLTVIDEEYRYIETYATSNLVAIQFQELYHRINDPLEMKNLAKNSAYIETMKAMRKKINKYKQSVLPH